MPETPKASEALESRYKLSKRPSKPKGGARIARPVGFFHPSSLLSYPLFFLTFNLLGLIPVIGCVCQHLSYFPVFLLFVFYSPLVLT
jgi:hypothetical protein